MIYECTAINHPWKIVGPTFVLKGGGQRVHLVCQRCGSLRTDRRSSNGFKLEGHSYKHSKGYEKFLTETRESKNRRADAWVALLAERSTRKETKRGSNHPNLRLVQGKRRRKTPLSHHRPRDKKYAQN